MKVNQYFLPLLLMILISGILTSAQTRARKEYHRGSGLIAEYVVIPRYFALALATQTQGKVVLEVEISGDGRVVSAKTKSGNKILGGNSIYAARLWKFNVSKRLGVKRKALLSFSYRLIARDQPLTSAVSVFKAPFSVDVVEFLPQECH